MIKQQIIPFKKNYLFVFFCWSTLVHFIVIVLVCNWRPESPFHASNSTLKISISENTAHTTHNEKKTTKIKKITAKSQTQFRTPLQNKEVQTQSIIEAKELPNLPSNTIQSTLNLIIKSLEIPANLLNKELFPRDYDIIFILDNKNSSIIVKTFTPTQIPLPFVDKILQNALEHKLSSLNAKIFENLTKTLNIVQENSVIEMHFTFKEL